MQNIFDAESLLMCWLYYSRYTLVILAANSNNSIAIDQSIYFESHFDRTTISKFDHIKSAFVAKLVKPTWLMDSSKSLRFLTLLLHCIGLLVPQVMSHYLLGTLRPPMYLDMLNLSSRLVESRKRPSLSTARNVC